MLKTQLQEELYNILQYWETHTVDSSNGGFIGRISGNNMADPYAVRGAVLNTRILWTFSAAYNLLQEQQWLDLAQRAWLYVEQYFLDKTNGGLYWSVDYNGQPVDTKKQVYAIAFGVYACSEYYKASGDDSARDTAISLYQTIMQQAFDPQYGGYFEAFAADWSELPDQRLSLKDANEKKSMNTHLHVLEAWTNLYTIWPDANLKTDIQVLLDIFSRRIIHPVHHHLLLFFQEDWTVKGDAISYGHDIEAAWLLLEAAEAIKDNTYISAFKKIAMQLSQASLEGLDADGGLWYELLPSAHHLVKEKHWWPQAEAMVGFINAWQLSSDLRYFEHATGSWDFIRDYLLDKKHGEWHWGVDAFHHPLDEDKVGLWKCPYHNARSCMELIKRL
ncbi:AGE family epimerase/isomerase [Chitinophaga sp. Cy-1792]|uniref:AGE family epimerase/isomerase n=1 Tax=Chitinophaga sp. Cy-1792 TaxID=2608339 RepID=UPI001F0402CA|nr:AGE family epimerase/isomerase [Chitinophaga sp. Cy-1792]